MKLSDLELYLAVHKVRKQVEQPNAEFWAHEKASEALGRVAQTLAEDGWPREKAIPCLKDVIRAWTDLRKNPKTQLTCDVSLEHKRRSCMYAGRGKGPCSDDIQLERIIPGSRGGEYTVENCDLACGKHNRERSDQPIENFLASDNGPVIQRGIEGYVAATTVEPA
jgi:hypothetical protein